MSKHTKVPWSGVEDPHGFPCVIGGDDRPVLCTPLYASTTNAEPHSCSEQAANVLRIVACVNALAGLNPEAVAGVVEALKDSKRLLTAASDAANRAGNQDARWMYHDGCVRITKALDALKDGDT